MDDVAATSAQKRYSLDSDVLTALPPFSRPGFQLTQPIIKQ